ncbi:MAG: ferric reductase-like transmembrane domain-containing protein [Candidatus Anstonellaceae archaeon]
MNRNLLPYLFVVFVVISLLFLYTAYDKKAKQLDIGRLVKVLVFDDTGNSLREFNKVAALAAIGLIAVAFILGPLSRLFPGIFAKYLYFRKPVGVIGFVFALAHSVYSLVEFYKLDINLMLYNNPKLVALVSGAVALAIFAAMTLTSTASAVKKMGYAKWKALQTTGYAGLLLTVVHFFVIETKPDVGFDVRPYGVLFFYLAIAALLLRLLMIFWGHKPREAYHEHFGEKEG